VGIAFRSRTREANLQGPYWAAGSTSQAPLDSSAYMQPKLGLSQNGSLSKPKTINWSEKIACGCVLVFSKDRKGHVELVERKLCSRHR
jgi:hypothetical protein